MRAHLTTPAMFATLIVVSLLMPLDAGAAEYNFVSVNFPDRHIRHRDFLMYVERFTNTLSINDSAFKEIPGLAGSCSSFESRNFHGFFMRHQNTRLKLAKFENQDLFRQDATFCLRQGLSRADGVSLESFNYPGSFVRHQDFELHIQPYQDNQLYKDDATFNKTSAAVSFGDDNVGIPASE